MAISSDKLTTYMNNFFGYGNLHGKVWFVGMEEGGGHSQNEIEARLNIWESVKKDNVEVVDLKEFHLRLLHELASDKQSQEDVRNWKKWFGLEKTIASQSTWRGLIRLFLGLTSDTRREIPLDSIKDFQVEHFGQTDSDTCLLELLPLPSPHVADWFYPQWVDLQTLDYLSSRQKYKEKLQNIRIERIKKLIEEYKPEYVIFYSRTYKDIWHNIIGSRTPMKEDDKFSFCTKAQTTFVIMPHPISRLENSKYTKIANKLKSK